MRPQKRRARQGGESEKGMDANLGSLDRVYEALAAPGGGKVKQPSNGDGAGVVRTVPLCSCVAHLS